MANVVEAVVSSFVDRLGDQINQEISSSLGIRERLEWVQSQFKWMQAFLKDAEAKSDKDERMKHWMREVEEVAYLAEDIIDSFFLEIEPLSQQGFSGAFDRTIAGRKLVSEIERMKKKIDSISESRAAYGIEDIRREEGTSTAGQSRRDQRLPSPHVEEPDFVGFQTDLEKLIEQLTQGERRRSVISIVGMGGLGKTTLAKKVYRSDAVRRQFHPCVWISISRTYGVVELLQAVIKKCMIIDTSVVNMGTSVENMELTADELREKIAEHLREYMEVNADELREKIAEHLRGKRYLLILDDIWSPEAWDDLKDAFPDTSNGSRVLLTTRKKEVALYADASSEPHALRFLYEEESWNLFLKKAFLGRQAHFPIDSQQLRKEIWSKCQGLPLAIVVIGGLLSRRKEPREWQNILKSISWQLIKGPEQIADILSLSYTDLPYYLKPCFLYLGIFPEDYEIPAKKLIQLWVAEGFIEERGRLTLEEAGEECLRELIQRSLIQLSAKSSSGAIKTCRIHDVLRDFTLSKVENDAFFKVESSAAAPKPCQGRRLAVHHGRFDFLHRPISRLRSLLIYHQDSLMFLNGGILNLIFRSFKFLRVLDIHQVLFESMASEIGELIHLRFVGCGVRSGEIHPNIVKLVNLQTLHISSTSNFLITIPIATVKMQQLRHVSTGSNNLWFRTEGHQCLDQMWSNNSLQTLQTVVACEWMNDGCLGRLTKLRKLGINVSKMENRECVERIWESIMRLESLESLHVTAQYLVKRADIGSLGQVPPLNRLRRLCKLNLKGKLENPRALYELPRNLTKLILEGSCSEQDPLPILEKLECLRILVLGEKSYTGKNKKMACSAGGFPQLQSLRIEKLLCLREWRVEKGSMPRLLQLFICECTDLKKVPDLQHLATLKKFEISRMSTAFTRKIDQDRGKEWYKIRHVSSIVID